jgi:hypothetical protein
MFRTVRARDIAKLIGINEELPNNLVQAILDDITPHTGGWHKKAVFGFIIGVREDARLQEKLLCLAGCQP